MHIYIYYYFIYNNVNNFYFTKKKEVENNKKKERKSEQDRIYSQHTKIYIIFELTLFIISQHINNNNSNNNNKHNSKLSTLPATKSKYFRQIFIAHMSLTE